MDTWVVVAIAFGAVLVVAMLAVVVVLVRRLLRTWRLLRGTDVSRFDRYLFYGALVYALSPVDLLPDPMLLDDIAVLVYALRSLEDSAGRAGLSGATRATRTAQVASRVHRRYRARRRGR